MTKKPPRTNINNKGKTKLLLQMYNGKQRIAIVHAFSRSISTV